MTKIIVETPICGYVEKRFDDGGDDCGWVELTRNFTDVLRGLGYGIPNDFEEYLDRKDSQVCKSENVFAPKKYVPPSSYEVPDEDPYEDPDEDVDVM